METLLKYETTIIMANVILSLYLLLFDTNTGPV